MSLEEFAQRSRSFIDRKSFLKMSGAGIAGAVLMATGAGRALAEPVSDLEKEFQEAAKEYKVPVEILLAMGYVNTRLEMPPPEASDYKKSEPGLGSPEARGAYGIMQLVKNPSSDTLGEASRLTGIPEEKLKTDRKSNIRGGAALLGSSQGKDKPPRLGNWLGAVDGEGGTGKRYKAVAGVGAGELYTDQVARALEAGISRRTRSGERVELRARGLSSPVTLGGGL